MKTAVIPLLLFAVLLPTACGRLSAISKTNVRLGNTIHRQTQQEEELSLFGKVWEASQYIMSSLFACGEDDKEGTPFTLNAYLDMTFDRNGVDVANLAELNFKISAAYLEDLLKDYGPITATGDCAVATDSFVYASNTATKNFDINSAKPGIDWGVRTVGAGCQDKVALHNILLNFDFGNILPALKQQADNEYVSAVQSMTYSCQRDPECPQK